MKGKERGRGSREKMGFCEIKKEKKKKKKRVRLVVGVKSILVAGVKSEGKGSFIEASLLVNIFTI